jgi:hypothetical protein
MKNKKAIDLVECLILAYMDLCAKRYQKLGEKKYIFIYHSWDVQTWYNLRNLFFNLITDEPSFDKFYDRFDAPGSTKGLQPIAWGPRFLPDLINDEIWDTKTKVEEKVKRIKKLYRQCIKLEKDFIPKVISKSTL